MVTKAGPKAGGKVAAKNVGKRFVKGQSGNPAGMKRGTKHRRTIWITAMSADDHATITEKIIAQAKRGCRASQKLITDKIEPNRRSVGKFKLPATIATLEDVDAAIMSIARAQAEGRLLPDEATAALATVESIRETIRDRNAVKLLEQLEGKFQA